MFSKTKRKIQYVPDGELYNPTWPSLLPRSSLIGDCRLPHPRLSSGGRRPPAPPPTEASGGKTPSDEGVRPVICFDESGFVRRHLASDLLVGFVDAHLKECVMQVGRFLEASP